MSEFQIEKGVVIPPSGNCFNARKYPWRTMKVGDSFFARGKTQQALGGSVSYAKKITGFNFTTRKVEGGVRVWRIA